MAHAAALQAGGQTVLVQPYDPRVRDGETALVFLGGRAIARVHQGPMLPPPGEVPVFDPSGTYAEERLAPAEPDFEVWDVGHAALAAAAAHLDIDATDLLYARVDVIGGAQRPTLLELELVEPSLGWRQLDDADTRARSSAGSPSASSQPCERLGLGPSRIDAHSAAVAAVQAAAPATCTATSAAGTPVKNCTVPTQALRAHQGDQHAEPHQHRPGRRAPPAARSPARPAAPGRRPAATSARAPAW